MEIKKAQALHRSKQTFSVETNLVLNQCSSTQTTGPLFWLKEITPNLPLNLQISWFKLTETRESFRAPPPFPERIYSEINTPPPLEKTAVNNNEKPVLINS